MDFLRIKFINGKMFEANNGSSNPEDIALGSNDANKKYPTQPLMQRSVSAPAIAEHVRNPTFF